MKKWWLIFLLVGFLIDAHAQADTIPVDTVQVQQVDTDSQSMVDKIDEASRKMLGLPTESVAKEKKGGSTIMELISMSNIFWTLVIIVVGYFSIKLISQALETFAERSTKYRITIKSFIPIIKIVGWVGVIFLIIAGVFQPPAATVLAFSASVGVAVGFASQDILKNMFGGIMILLDRPFKSGDKIEVGSYYGEVVEIGLRSTRIVTPDDNLVSIPNSEIMNSPVSNANAGEPNCQVVAEIYLPIEVDTARVRSIATQAAQVSKYIYLNKPIAVIFINEFKDRKSLLKMRLKAYVLDIRDEFRFKSEMTEIVIKTLVEEKIIKLDNE